MNIVTIQLEAIELQNGSFSAQSNFSDWHGGSVTFTPYNINGEYGSREKAYRVARAHAIQILKENYSDDVQVKIEER